MPIMPMPAHGTPAGVTGPATNLNIAMDYWGGPTAMPIPVLQGKDPATPARGTVVPTGLVGLCESEFWPQNLGFILLLEAWKKQEVWKMQLIKLNPGSWLKLWILFSAGLLPCQTIQILQARWLWDFGRAI